MTELTQTLYRQLDEAAKLDQAIQPIWRRLAMVSDFFTTTIGEQLTLQRGFDITKKEQLAGNVPVVSSGGISSFHNVAKVTAPGVVLGRKGSLGTVYFLKEDYWPHDTTLWVKDFKGNNPRFVYYFFQGMASELKKMDGRSQSSFFK